MKPVVQIIRVDSTAKKTYKWRIPTEAIACFELAVQCIGLVGVFGALPVLLFNEETPKSEQLHIYVIGVAVLLCLVVGIKISSLLLAATKTKINPHSALRKVKIWMTVNAVCTTFVVLQSMYLGDLILLFVSVIVRGGFMFVVMHFMGELEDACTIFITV